jgi:hypothetical protein
MAARGALLPPTAADVEAAHLPEKSVRAAA